MAAEAGGFYSLMDFNGTESFTVHWNERMEEGLGEWIPVDTVTQCYEPINPPASHAMFYLQSDNIIWPTI